MKHAFFETDRVRVFAHRGGGALAPENTHAAFANGLALGADGLELDVHLARDGVVVVHHDRRLERTTSLRGPIGERTSDELARADAGWHFRRDDGFPFRGRGIGVPTLAEVLARYRDVRVIIELKEDSVALAQAAVDVVRGANAVERVCFGSFSHRALHAVRAYEPAIATSAARAEVLRALVRLWGRRPPARVAYAGFQVPEKSRCIPVVSPRFVAEAHRAGLGVQVWTIDTPADAARLLACGVDALITDRPDVIVPLVRAAEQ